MFSLSCEFLVDLGAAVLGFISINVLYYNTLFFPGDISENIALTMEQI